MAFVAFVVGLAIWLNVMPYLKTPLPLQDDLKTLLDFLTILITPTLYASLYVYRKSTEKQLAQAVLTFSLVPTILALFLLFLFILDGRVERVFHNYYDKDSFIIAED